MSAGIGNDGGAGLFERWPQKTIQLAGGVLLLGFIGLAAPVGAQPRITEDGLLRIASWSLLDAVGAGVIARKKPVERSWRNTFGSERRIASRPAIAGEKLGADVVLLQGVKSIQEVRQIFPARDWKLILSRQVLRQNRGRINNDTVLVSNTFWTSASVQTLKARAPNLPRRLKSQVAPARRLRLRLAWRYGFHTWAPRSGWSRWLCPTTAGSTPANADRRTNS